jgi:hypothetical protein
MAHPLYIGISVGRFIVYLMAQRAMRCPVNICVGAGKVAISFCLQDEVNVLMDAVQVVEEVHKFM